MNEVANTTQLLITNRVADFLLCTFEPLVFFGTVANCVLAFKAPEQIEQLKADLINDPFERFNFMEQENGELLIGLQYLAESGRRIQHAVEEWRVRILHFLERAKSPVELGRIAVHVARPDNIPSSFKLKDILNADKLGRFSVHGSVDRLLVSRNLSAEEIEHSRQLWRDQTHDFLFVQPRDVTLAVLGNNVPRPANLPKHENKLIEVLNSDPERRFFFIQRTPAEIIVRVKLSEAQHQQLSEVWRVKAINYLLPKACAVLLSEVGANVKRPSIHFSTVTTLREVLLEDPHRRFHLFGQGLMLQVALLSPARAAQELLPLPPPVLPLHKGYNKMNATGDLRGQQPVMNAAPMHHGSRPVGVASGELMRNVRYGPPVAPPRHLQQSAPLLALPPSARYQLNVSAGSAEFSFSSAPSTSSHIAFRDPMEWDVVEEARRLKNLSDDFSDLFRLPPLEKTPPLSSPFRTAMAPPLPPTVLPVDACRDPMPALGCSEAAESSQPPTGVKPFPLPLDIPLTPAECSPLS